MRSSILPASTCIALFSAIPVISAEGKRGIAYNNPTWAAYFTKNSTQVTWAYNWAYTGPGLTSSLEFVPMLWGIASSNDVGNWQTAALAAKAVLGYNEPDLNTQANIIPSDAAGNWTTDMNPLAGKVSVGAPAVTNAGNGLLPYAGLGWLDSFFEGCTSCTVDFIPLHWYANDTADNFKAYLTEAHERFNKTIWVTEFMLQDSADNQIAFLKDVMPWMDQQSWIGRYAYFGAFEGMLVNGQGTGLSSIGEAYIA
ncbi:hypothetical protein PISL3812_08125 [Talaromyces islandicus]|uniref:Asl1-like glycosyl hydrolase catalytic domain-containing protein n=1 Tax=Talaromyces islandicus TaxID=28573 RepID=A0A0U1M6C3_TALIS|nr:hypothetical protein PISL3812_08125 [Talaromyces islandicus]